MFQLIGRTNASTSGPLRHGSGSTSCHCLEIKPLLQRLEGSGNKRGVRIEDIPTFSGLAPISVAAFTRPTVSITVEKHVVLRVAPADVRHKKLKHRKRNYVVVNKNCQQSCVR